jgi:hypothetical protein
VRSFQGLGFTESWKIRNYHSVLYQPTSDGLQTTMIASIAMNHHESFVRVTG